NPPVVLNERAPFRAADAGGHEQEVLFDGRCGSEKKARHAVASVGRRVRVAGELRAEVEAAAAAIGLELRQLTAPCFQTVLQRVPASQIREADGWVEGVFDTHDGQRTGLADTLI